MKASLQLRLSQHLALTPQLQQSIRLLQLSTLELQQEVAMAVAQNPLLENDEWIASPRRVAADGSLIAQSPPSSTPEPMHGGGSNGSEPSGDRAERDDSRNGDDYDYNRRQRRFGSVESRRLRSLLGRLRRRRPPAAAGARGLDLAARASVRAIAGDPGGSARPRAGDVPDRIARRRRLSRRGARRGVDRPARGTGSRSRRTGRRAGAAAQLRPGRRGGRAPHRNACACNCCDSIRPPRARCRSTSSRSISNCWPRATSRGCASS